MLEILDGGALAQEFRVGHDLDGRVRTPLAQDAFDLVAGTDRDRRFGHHHGRAGENRRDLAHRVVDEAQIGMTVAAARRRTHRDEHGFGIGRALRFRGEFEPALAEVRFDEVGKARLEDRNLAAVERGDAAGILVDAGHLMTEIGKAGAGDEPDIASPDHGHAHEKLRSSSGLIGFRGRGRRSLERLAGRRGRLGRAQAQARKPLPPEQHRDQRAIEQAAEQPPAR